MEPTASPPDLYRIFRQEREEILRHKWIESEKAGRDVGFEQALVDWMKRHRDAWLKWLSSQWGQ